MVSAGPCQSQSRALSIPQPLPLPNPGEEGGAEQSDAGESEGYEPALKALRLYHQAIAKRQDLQYYSIGYRTYSLLWSSASN